jgi:ERO1-like protein alpha
MHSSISAHIAKEYLLDEKSNTWGPNLALFQERLGNEAVRERVENLYFAYLFVLRAALKAGPLLQEVAYETGSPKEDAHTAELVRRLVRASTALLGCLLQCSLGACCLVRAAEEKCETQSHHCESSKSHLEQQLGCEVMEGVWAVELMALAD